MEDSGDFESRVSFLQKAALLYSKVCPPLASHLGSRLSLNLNRVHRKSIVTCPHCSSPTTTLSSSTTTPATTSTTRTLTQRHLRRRRRQGHARGHFIYSITSKHWRSYVVMHCRRCGRTSVMNGCNLKSNRDISNHFTQTCNTRAAYTLARPKTPANTPGRPTSSKTPPVTSASSSSTSRKRKSSGCGLKAALNRSKTFDHNRREALGCSPRLSEFLSSTK